MTNKSPTPSERLKVAFLGGAYNSAAGRLHRTAIEMDLRFNLVSGCFSRRPEVNLATAKQYGIELDRAHADLVSLLNAETQKVDAIVILTPTDQHIEQICQIKKFDLPIICEKALVSSVAQAMLLRKRNDETKKDFLAVTYNYTGYPMVRELKHKIELGELGKITQVRAEMPQQGFSVLDVNGQPIIPQEWRLRDGEVPTVSLDLGVHLHALIKFLTASMPESVIAVTGTKGNFQGLGDSVSCLARYSNGMDCCIWYSKAALGHRNGMRIEIYGTKGSAIWIQENPEQLLVSDVFGNREIIDRASTKITIANQPRYTRFKAGHPTGFIEAFANYYSDVADSLLTYRQSGFFEEGSFIFGPDTAIEGIHFLNAIAKSSETGKWVNLNRENNN